MFALNAEIYRSDLQSHGQLKDRESLRLKKKINMFFLIKAMCHLSLNILVVKF